MNRFRLITIVGAAIVAIAPVVIDAHHSGVMFEEEKEVTLGCGQGVSVHQPAFLAARGCDEPGRHGDHVGFRDRGSEHDDDAEDSQE